MDRIIQLFFYYWFASSIILNSDQSLVISLYSLVTILGYSLEFPKDISKTSVQTWYLLFR